MLKTWILLVKFFGFNPNSPSLVNSALKIFARFEASADQWWAAAQASCAGWLLICEAVHIGSFCFEDVDVPIAVVFHLRRQPVTSYDTYLVIYICRERGIYDIHQWLLRIYGVTSTAISPWLLPASIWTRDAAQIQAVLGVLGGVEGASSDTNWEWLCKRGWFENQARYAIRWY